LQRDRAVTEILLPALRALTEKIKATGKSAKSAGRRPFRIFLSGNCQFLYLADALKYLFRNDPKIVVHCRTSYQKVQPYDGEFARHCDVHLAQIANFDKVGWAEVVPDSSRRIRVPLVALPGIFHAFRVRVHSAHPVTSQPYYLAKGNDVLLSLATQFSRGNTRIETLLARYLDYQGREIRAAPRLLEMNRKAMGRIALNSDFDIWSIIEPRIHQERFFWNEKHPTRRLHLILLDNVLEALGLAFDLEDLEQLRRQPEYHEPYHAPIHPRLADALGLEWAKQGDKLRFYQEYFSLEEHARIFIAGDFADAFALGRAIHATRMGRGGPATVSAFAEREPTYSRNGQPDYWYGYALYRLGCMEEAAERFEIAHHRMLASPHPVQHRVDVTPERCLNTLAAARHHLTRSTAKRRILDWVARVAPLSADSPA
jgi:hypothetical protein